MLDRLRTTFELYGFAPLETRAVEPLDQLLRKGETSKEVYVLRRLQADADDSDPDDALGLHFDLTVPFARYVLENAGKLRSRSGATRSRRCGGASGRRRAGTASSSRPTSTWWTGTRCRSTTRSRSRWSSATRCGGLPIPPVRIQVNNRKLCQGFYRGLGIERPRGGAARGGQARQDRPGRRRRPAGPDRRRDARRRRRPAWRWPRSRPRTRPSWTRCARSASTTRCSTRAWTSWSGSSRRPGSTAPGCCVADLKIARGLDYYTGTVYETQHARVRAARLDLLRRPLRQPGRVRAPSATRAWASRSASPGCSACSSAPAR